MKYLKFVVSVVMAGGQAVPALVADGKLDSSDFLKIAIAGAGSLMVFFGPNSDAAPYTKAIMAAITAGLLAAASYIGDGITVTEWGHIGVAALGAVFVYFVPNASQ